MRPLDDPDAPVVGVGRGEGVELLDADVVGLVGWTQFGAKAVQQAHIAPEVVDIVEFIAGVAHPELVHGGQRDHHGGQLPPMAQVVIDPQKKAPECERLADLREVQDEVAVAHVDGEHVEPVERHPAGEPVHGEGAKHRGDQLDDGIGAAQRLDEIVQHVVSGLILGVPKVEPRGDDVVEIILVCIPVLARLEEGIGRGAPVLGNQELYDKAIHIGAGSIITQVFAGHPETI